METFKKKPTSVGKLFIFGKKVGQRRWLGLTGEHVFIGGLKKRPAHYGRREISFPPKLKAPLAIRDVCVAPFSNDRWDMNLLQLQ